MSNSGRDSANAGAAAGTRGVMPATAGGWWALGASVVGLASWVVLPMITIAFRETYPITDTWVMPALGMALIDVAAVLDVLCIWPWRQRSVLNVIATVATIPAALFASFMVIGEALAGV